MPRTFSSQTQELTYTKVAEYLKNSTLFQNSVSASKTQPRFDINYGSAHVAVEVLPWEVHPWEEKELAIVRAFSYVTVSSEISEDLMRYLLLENQRMRFGSFQLGGPGEVLFAHNILGGDGMDLLELQSCILAVVTIADTYDDIIADKFGGQRASDRVA